MMKPTYSSYSELKEEAVHEQIDNNRNTSPSEMLNPNPIGISSLPSNVSSAASANRTNNIQNAAQVEMANNTLDEPVSETLKRDLLNIWYKLRMVLIPKGNQDLLKDWDLWGPLILCLTLALCLAASAPANQSVIVFTLVFVIVWCGSVVVTINGKLLGGNISFFQSICVLGYCIFPLVIAAIVALFVPFLLVKGLIALGAFLWSFTASVGFLGETNLDNRKLLATYPIFLFYFIIAWIVLISKSIV